MKLISLFILLSTVVGCSGSFNDVPINADPNAKVKFMGNAPPPKAGAGVESQLTEDGRQRTN